MELKEIKAVIECMLFVSDKPMALGTIQGMLEDVDRRTVLACLDELKAEYDMQGRAFHLAEIAEGYQLATRVQYAPWIRKMFKSRTSNKLSRAALETLAIIAYRQPITKAEIEDVRGVSADGVVNALLDRKFIRIVGRKEVVGRPILYGTTKEFLHYFGLKDLTDMPMLKDLQDILDSDEAGNAWKINPQGELVAKIKVGEEGEKNDSLTETAQPEEKNGTFDVHASEAAGEESQETAAETEEPDESGNGKQDVELEKDEDELSDEITTSELSEEEDNNGGHPQAEDLVSSQRSENTAATEPEPKVAAVEGGEEDDSRHGS